jgi:monofunctional biosynthetic peptidoglycan transglycosylase
MVQVALVMWSLRHVPDILSLDKKLPIQSAFMKQRAEEDTEAGRKPGRDYRPVPLSRISPYLIHAVLVAEDAAFYQHSGLDFREMWNSAQKNWEEGGFKRGGSTISQQLVKNLYLSPDKTIHRKVSEIILTLMMEQVTPKRRILEIYLNVIEWGHGVYGCEAAAQRHFKTSCALLTPEQAIRLASVVINPRRYFPADNKNQRMKTRRTMIAERMLHAGWLTQAEAARLLF